MSEHQLDPDALKMMSFTVFSKLEGAVTAGMIHLGDALGLYAELARREAPVPVAGLAASLGLHERWVREWASNQVAARIVSCDDMSDPALPVYLSPEAKCVLASPRHPAFGMGMFHRLPQTMDSLRRMPESFRTGIGHDYDSHGPEGAVGIERSFEPWNQSNLVPNVLPALEGVVDKLRAGARVVDIGCGAGGLAMLIASTFPASEVVGYDISRHALERARSRQAEASLGNVRFVDPRDEPLPSDGSLDLVCTFDCIHDMTRPTEMMRTIRSSMKNDGTWLLVDIKALDTLEMNVSRNPMASLLYGISVLSCMSSAMSEPEGEGLGTLGLPESRARDMAAEAGFTRFRRLDVEHSVNAFYEIRP
ncbi:MAG: class I SAM-dependent methyltransferase [Ilumatobacteraceae bacterium]